MTGIFFLKHLEEHLSIFYKKKSHAATLAEMTSFSCCRHVFLFVFVLFCFVCLFVFNVFTVSNSVWLF